MTNLAIELPPPSGYGAVEIKQFINKFTIRGFLFTIAFLALLFLLYWAFVTISASEGKILKTAPIVKLTLENLPPPSQADDIPPPPTQTIINTGPMARAGTPVPVPDAQITEDLAAFANVDELSRASAEGGDGIDLGGFASNIDFDAKDVDVKVREEEPGIDEFIPVEKEPYIDLAELQKKIIYPEIARRAGIEGKVLIRILVEKDGKPKRHRIEYSDNEQLNKAAIKAVMSSVFTPAIQNDRPVTCWVTIPVTFRLR
ncbi:energy transducer TonB [Bacteroidota bacterium]